MAKTTPITTTIDKTLRKGLKNRGIPIARALDVGARRLLEMPATMKLNDGTEIMGDPHEIVQRKHKQVSLLTKEIDKLTGDYDNVLEKEKYR